VRSLAVVLALAFVSAASAGRTPAGVVRGTVTRGPITPVCSTAHPCDEPAAGAKIVFFRNGRPIAHTTTRADGSYRIRLAGGRYGVRIRGAFRWTPTRVLVRRGRVTRLDIAIDTGIR
jgi:Carboxypeptidase regulatory-like domain